jgi:hypothetical protein
MKNVIKILYLAWLLEKKKKKKKKELGAMRKKA